MRRGDAEAGLGVLIGDEGKLGDDESDAGNISNVSNDFCFWLFECKALSLYLMFAAVWSTLIEFWVKSGGVFELFDDWLVGDDGGVEVDSVELRLGWGKQNIIETPILYFG